jgi:anthranilate synthase / indole-3-glycerol phosphate synthase
MFVCLIDNYDSFTWNLYQYLCLEGARVEVFRNDQITIDELIEKRPDSIVVSPGPGHPQTDAGISCEVIEKFAGKVPIFGVCMGQQCIFSVFGGDVGYAGEIVHGKTSTVNHDGKGVFKGLGQEVEVTRYHSLAGTNVSVPECLEITAKSSNSIIMGVRHKKYTVEGVQFHPESILTEEGHAMIRNFLSVRGGTWEGSENSAQQEASGSTNGGGSILERIYAQRKVDVEKLKQVPGKGFKDLEQSLNMGLAPRLISFYDRLLSGESRVNLMAEVKRASPSKGPIGMDIHAPTQALKYAQGGAATISVLCEPHWFKGDLEDLALVRRAVADVENRPAVLLKDFVFDEYQILQARLAGADTVLLIVKMLDDNLLSRLYTYSKSLHMEPLVEVSDAAEMERALKLNAKVIGVNNRDLHSFHVDLNVTSSLVSQVPEDTILAALSGITSRKEVDKYVADGVKAILVGESLMRAKDVDEFIKTLIH